MIAVPVYKIIVGNPGTQGLGERHKLAVELARAFLTAGLAADALVYEDDAGNVSSDQGVVLSITPAGELFGRLIQALGPWLGAAEREIKVKLEDGYLIKINAANFREITAMFAMMPHG